MKIKKPSLKGIPNTGYLGHFAMDKYIEKGHNFSGNPGMTDEEKKRKEYEDAPMAYDAAEKYRRQEAEWKAGAKEREREERKRRMERAIRELKYGREADFREVIRSGMKRQKRY